MSGNKRKTMINKAYIHFALFLCLSCMAACMNVEEFEEPVQMIDKVFYADMENTTGTKTVLGDKDSLGLRTIYWSPEDSVGVAPFTASNGFFSIFKNTKTELSDRAVFEGKTEIAQEYVAIYPYDENTILESGSIYFELDAVQKYLEGTFDQGAFPMIAKLSNTDENILKFLNLCGILEINLKGEEKVESIIFSSDNYISGRFCASLDYETYPEIKASGSNTHNVKLDCGDGVQLDSSSPKSFYLVLPPAEYQSFSVLVRTTDGKLMNKQSTKPLTITRSRLTAAGALAYVESVSIDLSLRGTSNCYVVPTIGMHKFNATIIGNGADGIIADADFHTADPNITPSFVEVLWESKGYAVQAEKGELVTDVTLTEDGYVDFYTTGVEGNALVAVMDADSTILWSWHLWLTDQPDVQHYVNSRGEFDVMDRNLGATRADKGVGDEWQESCGVDFQWGRKDPLSAYNFTESNQITTIAQSIMSPNIKATSWDFGPSKSLWSTSQKTIYDPCPPGYRTTPLDVWADFSIQNVSGSYDNGWNFMYDGVNTAWYPVRADHTPSGIRYWTDSYMAVANRKKGVYFSSSHFSTTTRVTVGQTRCMKDDNYINPLSAVSKIEEISDIAGTSASIKSVITYVGMGEITSRGIVYGTSPGFSVDAATKIEADDETLEFTIELTGLETAQKYYVRAYAVNGDGISYSDEVSFYTLYVGESVDLSKDGTANCYIVPPVYSTYTFDYTVKGNSLELVGDVASVEVLWETKNTLEVIEKGDIISDVELLDGKVRFMLPGDSVPGNALIAVKDASDNILWSWHIWVTDTPKEQYYITASGTYFVLDRNIGAIRPDWESDDVWKESIGTYYQWGRKDPFIGGLYTVVSEQISLDTSIAQPTLFPATDAHWLTPTDYELWNSSEKTVYDPCPPGYVVGSSDLWSNFLNQDLTDANKGWNLIYDGINKTWIPAASWIDVYGSPINHNYEVYMWSGNYNKNLHIIHYNAEEGGWRLNNGFTVRCMSETGANVQLTTDPVTDVTKTSADVSGSMYYIFDADISEMGFVWTDSQDSLDINSNKVNVEVAEGIFNTTLTNLTPGTTYNVRTFAVYGDRVVYSPVVSFATKIAVGGEDVPETDDYEW